MYNSSSIKTLSCIASKYALLFLFLIFLKTSLVLAQPKVCRTDILNSLKIHSENSIQHFNQYDFSTLWTNNDENFTFGIIGEEHQRVRVKFITIERNISNPSEYLVFGKSNVNNNVCDFVGKITLTSIHELASENYGIDDEYKNEKIQFQCMLTAKYEFFENKNQTHAGYFTGTTQSLFYIDKHNKVQYNNIAIESDGYFNNAFVGKWQLYNSTLEKICNWADYRVPNSNCDFDIGAGGFSVSDKYIKNGWQDIEFIYSLDGNSNDKTTNNKVKKWWE